MHDDLLTIRQMCETFGVTPRTLRFYEARNLLSPQRRGQHRLYSRRDRGRLILILRGRRYGFSLEEIGGLLDMYDPAGNNAGQTRAAVALARRRLVEMRTQQEELATLIHDLEAQVRRAIATLPPTTPAPDTPHAEDQI